MKIKFLRQTVIGDDAIAKKGEVKDLPDKQAKDLILLGRAEEAKPAAKKAVKEA